MRKEWVLGIGYWVFGILYCPVNLGEDWIQASSVAALLKTRYTPTSELQHLNTLENRGLGHQARQGGPTVFVLFSLSGLGISPFNDALQLFLQKNIVCIVVHGAHCGPLRTAIKGNFNIVRD